MRQFEEPNSSFTSCDECIHDGDSIQMCVSRRCIHAAGWSFKECFVPKQPEPFTDKEQRIFLAAMLREEEICKKVDDERIDCREPYEGSLVRTCHEIKRKVKSVLWNA